MPFPGLLSKSRGPVATDLAIWWKIPAVTGFTDGQRLTSVLDLSGNGHNSVTANDGNSAVYKTTSVTINGLPVAQFTASESLNHIAANSATINTSGWSGATMFIVGRNNNDPSTGINSSGLCYMSKGYDFAQHFPFTDGVIYDNSFTTTRQTVGNPTPSLTSPWCYVVMSQNGSWIARLNGTQIFSTASNTFAGNDNSVHTTQIGIAGSGPSVSDHFFDGVFGEFLLYSVILDAPRLSQTENYLIREWGI